MTDTPIAWTHRPGTRGRSWNPTRGCALKSAGCKHCYAMRQARRFAGPGQAFEGLVNIKTGKWTGEGRFVADKLLEPMHWRDPSTVFVDSMSDLFYEGFSNEEIAAVFGVMAACPLHQFLILTKRAERLPEWFDWVLENGPAVIAENAWARTQEEDRAIHERLRRPAPWPLPNVWLGVSVEDQDAANERIPHLRSVPAAVRFLSCEPLLGPLDLLLSDIDWVIVGAESGPGARPCDDRWLADIQAQCKRAGVAYFLKQAIESDRVTEGKASGRKARNLIESPLFDGQACQEFPR